MTGLPTHPGMNVSSSELGELFSAFNDVTSRLQETHEKLTGEVVRLKGELRRANDELDRSRRLAALGEMAAGIAHEVRNPLGSIGLYAEMLTSDLADRPEECEIARKIRRVVSGLDAVVGDVLSFSRTMQVRRIEVGLPCAIARAAESCREVLEGEPGVEMALIGEPREIRVDASLLQQALVNVVRNAAEAARSNAEVRPPSIEVYWGESTIERDDESVRAVVIRVSDSGQGVTDEVRERMFNPFFTTRNVGTGLGLAIVHRIVDAHGGQIRVRNAGGDESYAGGAVVELLLPAVCDEMDIHVLAGAARASGSVR